MDALWQGTILFADVRGDIPTLYADVGAAKGLQAVRRCLDLLQQAARDCGGRVLKTTGDEIIAVFPAAAEAADAAEAMQYALDALPMVGNVRLGARIAFHSGPFIVRDGDVLGETVNLAAELIQQAQRDQILTSGKTAAAMARSYKSRMRELQAGPAPGKAAELPPREFVWRAGTETVRLRADAAGLVSDRTLLLKYGATEIRSEARRHDVVTIGRGGECDLVVLDALTSRRHCAIEVRAGAFVLIDHSTNGTYVTEEGDVEIMIEQTPLRLHKHGWLAFGQPREKTSHVVEYFCA